MKNANEPAFAACMVDSNSGAHHIQSGLTKREYFAAMAMQGLIGSYNNIYIESPESKFEIAKHAVKFADALLTELDKVHSENPSL